MFLFLFGVNKTKLGKKYKKMYINWKDQKIENQAIEEIKGTEYYQYLPEYRGKNTFVPSGLFLEKIAIIIFSVMSFLPTIGFIYIAVRDNDLTVLIYIFFTLLIVPGVCLLSYLLSLKRKVTIDEDGVKLRRKKNGKIKTRFFSWDDVKVIALSVSPEGKRISWGYIYFTTKEIKKDRVIIEYFEKPYVIMLKYRPKVVHCVLKYWNKEIRNLEAMKNWKRYIDKIK